MEKEKYGGLGERLKIVRQQLDETQTTFAARFKLKRYDIANYERGLSDLPSRVMGYLDEMGFNISWLVTGAGQMRKVDELLIRFKTLSKEFDLLSLEYHQTREELLRVMAVAEPDQEAFNRAKGLTDENEGLNSKVQKTANRRGRPRKS